MTAPVETDGAAWLVALDIDGTVLHGDGSISNAVIGQVRRLDAAGHQVMLATGRSSAATIPVVEQLGTTLRFLVCSNGAKRLPARMGGGVRPDRCASVDPRPPKGVRRITVMGR